MGRSVPGHDREGVIVRVFLDDLRTPPIGDRLCRTAGEAIALLKSGVVTFISFDHDLGVAPDGYSVACYIERSVADGRISCPDWAVHSANPVGGARIASAMRSAERFHNEREG